MANHSLPSAPCVQILRLPQVCKVTGLGRSMIYQLEAQRRFPCRVRIGARAVGWVEAEVQGCWRGVWSITGRASAAMRYRSTHRVPGPDQVR